MTPTVQRIEEHAVPVESVRTIDRIVTDLSRPVAARHVRTRQQGGATIQFIEWHTAAQYLDLYAPGWSWTIHEIKETAGLLMVHGSLTVPTATGPVERHATGVEDITPRDTETRSPMRRQWHLNGVRHSLDLADTCIPNRGVELSGSTPTLWHSGALKVAGNLSGCLSV